MVNIVYIKVYAPTASASQQLFTERIIICFLSSLWN